MATTLACVLGIVLGAGDGVTLREAARPGQAARIVAEMRAEGELRPEATGGAAARPVPLKVASRLDWVERPLAPGRAVRQVRDAVVRIEATARPMTTRLRPERSLLVAERHGGAVRSFSPTGPLTRPELDLVQSAADPLVWEHLLPGKPVAAGDTWDLGPEIARALSDYEIVTSHTLRAKLENADANSVRVRVAGRVQGSARGGEGTLRLNGFFTFDRQAGGIDRLSLTRSEVRKPGAVEPGLAFEGTLDVTRSTVPTPPELSEAALANLRTEATPAALLLQFVAPSGTYQLLHDRDWHLFWDDARLAVFRRLEGGALVAQCNLSVGPDAGKGRHQDPAQLRDDIQKALGPRFVAWLGEGEIDSANPEDYVYRVVAQGKEGDQAVVWSYYLIANPEGKQLLATFTLNAADQQKLGAQDLQMIGSLEWVAAGTTGPVAPEPPRE